MAAVGVVNSLPKVLIPPAEERCQLSRQEELKYVAFHFTNHLVRNKLIRKPAILSKEQLIKFYINYQPSYPSHVKSSEILEALREARLLKRRRVAAGGDNANIEFKDQIFYSEENQPSTVDNKDVMKPRFRILTNQNYTFKNKLTKDPEIAGSDCLLCKETFQDLTALTEHCTTRTHFLKKTYRDNRLSFLRKLEGLDVENAHEYNFQIHQESRAIIKFRNVADKELEIKVHRIDSLVNIPSLTILHDAPATIRKGETFDVTLKACFNKYDAKKYPMVVEISLGDSSQFIDLLLEPKYVVLDEELRCLEATAPYEPMAKNYEPVYDLPVISGVPIPRPKGDLTVTKIPLLAHEIPTALRRVLNHGFKKFVNMSESDDKKLQEVRDLLCNDEKTEVLHNTLALNALNYVNRFRHLMWIEEHQMEKDIRSYNLKEVVMSTERRGYLGLEVPGLLEGRPSIIPGDSVYICKQNDTVKYEGVVHFVEQNKLYLMPNKEAFLNKYIGEKVNIEFSFNRYCLKIQHRALDQIVKRQVGHVLFPSKCGAKVQSPKVILKPFFNVQIKNNEQQQEAVQNIVNNTAYPAPFVIYGPPGTGKTATMVESITQIWALFPSKKICVCAPSNWAADVLTERLIKSIPVSNVLRLYSTSRANVPDNLQKCSNYDSAVKELYLPTEAAIRSKKIVVMTPITAGRLISAGFTGGHFDYLFIDEAGHAIEMEMIVPIIGLLTREKDVGFTGSLVLAGDPKQLGPIVRSSLAINLGYGMSLLERLINHNHLYQKDEECKGGYNANIMVKLVKNYRSHSVILKVPNDLFYDGHLQTHGPPEKINCACRWEELPTRNFPLIFHGVKGLEDREKNSPSYFNRLEIQILANYVEKLMTTRLSGFKVTEKDIGIIAPYRKQVQKIRQFLNNKKYPNIDVASVEEFQGQEKLIIIISTVRSRFEYVASDYQFGLGFLRSEKRFNVAVTRAKALLIVIGNPDVLQCDTRWRALMDYCSENGSYRGEKAADRIAEGFDVNKKLKMDLSALVKNADECPIEEKPGFRREE